MREIISLQVGGCGCRIGTTFWKSIMREHSIDTNTGERLLTSTTNSNGLTSAAAVERKKDNCAIENVHIFLNEKEEDNFQPRVVMADLENDAIHAIRSSTSKQLLSDDNYCTATPTTELAGNVNNFARGFYTDGALLIEQVMDQVRIRLEECDSCEGFQLFHSLMGGSGSGLGCLIACKVREEFPDKMFATASIAPSFEDDFSTISTYNSALSVHYLVENCDFVSLFGNQAIENYTTKMSQNTCNTFENVNSIISQSLCGITSSFRFGGALNSGYRKFGTNLVPFPRLHFFALSQTQPVFASGTSSTTTTTSATAESLIRDLFDESNFLISTNPKDGKFMCNSITFRGEDFTISQIEESVSKFKKENQSQFKEWIPNNIHTSQCKVPGASFNYGSKNSSATMISNTSAIQNVFKTLSERFTEQFRTKALLHLYADEGMDEMEFMEAESNLNDLISEYYDNWGCWIDDEEEQEDEQGL